MRRVRIAAAGEAKAGLEDGQADAAVTPRDGIGEIVVPLADVLEIDQAALEVGLRLPGDGGIEPLDGIGGHGHPPQLGPRRGQVTGPPKHGHAIQVSLLALPVSTQPSPGLHPVARHGRCRPAQPVRPLKAVVIGQGLDSRRIAAPEVPQPVGADADDHCDRPGSNGRLPGDEPG